jgi:predicted DNA-binding transcriptional regulator AlpA
MLSGTQIPDINNNTIIQPDFYWHNQGLFPADQSEFRMPRTRNKQTENHETLLISANTLARLLDVSLRTIQRLCQQGKAPKPARFGRNARWRLDIIMRWIDEGCPPMDEFDSN